MKGACLLLALSVACATPDPKGPGKESPTEVDKPCPDPTQSRVPYDRGTICVSEGPFKEFLACLDKTRQSEVVQNASGASGAGIKGSSAGGEANAQGSIVESLRISYASNPDSAKCFDQFDSRTSKDGRSGHLGDLWAKCFLKVQAAACTELDESTRRICGVLDSPTWCQDDRRRWCVREAINLRRQQADVRTSTDPNTEQRKTQDADIQRRIENDLACWCDLANSDPQCTPIFPKPWKMNP